MKSTKLDLFFLLVLLFPLLSNGQKQTNNWYFGDKAGLNFNGILSAIGTGQLNTQEGCSGYSNPSTGQLLFYTNGDTIWNKNNQKMPNGIGIGGHKSSSQSGLVVPRPGSTTQFYVFSVGAWGGMNSASSGSFNLNLVDMNLNGGLGDVTIKNQMVLSPVCEKLTATLHCNGVDYWVVVHKFNSNKFYSYLLTSAGLSAVPVISTIGIMHSDTLGGNGFSAIGYMKISPNGKKLALACYSDIRTVEIFDFNYSNGTINNEIIDDSWFNYHGNSGLYGLAFSPDNSKLYISGVNDSTIHPSSVYQYDLSTNNAVAILASKTIINTSLTQSYGALQLAPNGKIYLAKASSPKLDVINTPNLSGAPCNYVTDGLQMGNQQGQHISRYGLPNFVEIFNTPTHFNLTYGGCGGTYTATLLDTIIPFPVTVTWNFGDPASGVNNTSTLLDPTHIFSTLGTYNISLTITTGCTNFIYNTSLDLTDSFQVDYGPDQTICVGNNIQLTNLFQYGLNYQWTPATDLSCANCSSPIANPNSTSTYIVSIDDGPGCHDEDTIVINITNGVTAFISNDTTICPSSSVQLLASGGTSYLWFIDSTLSSYNIPNPFATPIIATTYSVIVSTPGCTPDTASVTVSFLLPPDINAGSDLTIFNGNSVLIEATSNGLFFLWQPGNNLNDSTILQPLASPTITTTYIVITDNGFGCLAVDTVIITVNDGTEPILYFPNVFSPNQDGINDFFDYFNSGFEKVWMRIYNRWGETVYQTDLQHDGWDGTFDDLPCSMGVYVYYAIGIDKGKKYFFKGNFTLLR